ncbi:GTPase [Chlorobaculum limnaeum]|uniref:GTPase n=1 Tax=Chlorobaculum limnaeum TaxID=274537 RepID=A0A1D8D3C4_CHLLM|nr:GTPase [Chlorobaculum limnaeum]AOS83477.1 GTPase [Chlorobaculum limnaeum]
MTTSLIFIYSTDSGTASALLDTGHKALSPSTYHCSLCELTQDTLGEKVRWREFRTSIGLPMEFFHRDEFERKYDLAFDYPVILRKNDKIEILLNKERIDKISNLDDLIDTIRQEMAKTA